MNTNTNYYRDEQVNFLKIIKFEIFRLISNKFMNLSLRDLPQEVQGYRILSQLPRQTNTDTNRLGIYQNKKGEKAFGKILSFPYKNVEYYKLKNEIAVYKILKKYYQTGDITVPKFLGTQESTNTLLLLVTYIEGKRLDQCSSNKKADVSLAILETITHTGKKLSASEKTHLSKRYLSEYLLLYPYLFLLAFFKYPQARRELIQGALLFLRSMPLLFTKNQIVLSHRDFHTKNIIVKKNEKTLIDFESCGYTFPYFDEVTLLRHEWEDKVFVQKFIQALEVKNKHDKKFTKYFTLLIVLIATHSLTDNGFSKKEAAKIIDFLRYGITYRTERKAITK